MRRADTVDSWSIRFRVANVAGREPNSLDRLAQLLPGLDLYSYYCTYYIDPALHFVNGS